MRRRMTRKLHIVTANVLSDEAECRNCGALMDRGVCSHGCVTITFTRGLRFTIEDRQSVELRERSERQEVSQPAPVERSEDPTAADGVAGENPARIPSDAEPDLTPSNYRHFDRSPWMVEFYHQWDSFTSRVNWRDFTFICIEGEWNHSWPLWEFRIVLLGLGLRVVRQLAVEDDASQPSAGETK